MNIEIKTLEKKELSKWDCITVNQHFYTYSLFVYTTHVSITVICAHQ